MNIKIHQVKKSVNGAQKCVHCNENIPFLKTPFDKGDYIGVVSVETLDLKISYRIGQNNQDALCNGTPAQEFHNKPLEEVS